MGKNTMTNWAVMMRERIQEISSAIKNPEIEAAIKALKPGEAKTPEGESLETWTLNRIQNIPECEEDECRLRIKIHQKKSA